MPSKLKISNLGEYSGYSSPKYKGFEYDSLYIDVSDGTKLAIDIYLPKKGKKYEQFPTICYFLRYTRSFELRFPFKMIQDPFFGTVSKEEVNFFTSHGYAVAVADMRGSGASFGTRKMEFSDAEVKDMGEVLEWISTQKWSNGRTATTGSSYTGTTAEFALSTHHKSLKAAIPRSSIFDLYLDINFPGGVRQSPFIKTWGDLTYGLDNQDYTIFHKHADKFVKGIKPVKSDSNGELLTKAMEQHKENYNIFEGIFRIECRNDIEPVMGFTNDDFSIHKRIKQIESSEVPMYRITGWYDASLVNSAIKGYLNTSNTKKLLIGPWDHGFKENINPFEKSQKRKFDLLSEMLRFFDFYVKDIDNKINKEPPVIYYQMGKNKYFTSNTWPVNQTKHQTYFLNANQKLVKTASYKNNAVLTYDCNYDTDSGKSIRWNSLTPPYRNGKIKYKNWHENSKKLFSFKSTVLHKSIEITGHPVVELELSVDAEDVQLFAYLEDVSPNGKKTTYITEGIFRALHRKEIEETELPYKFIPPYHSYKLEDIDPVKPNEKFKVAFDFIPTSYLLKKGHHLQLSIGVNDKSHFDQLENSPKKLNFHFDESCVSKLIVPIIEKN